MLTVVDPDAVAVTKRQRRHLQRLLTQIETTPEVAREKGDVVVDTLTLLIDP